MRPVRRPLLLGILAGLCGLAVGCPEESPPRSEPPAEQAAPAEAPPAPIRFEPHQWDFEHLTVTGTVPAGWVRDEHMGFWSSSLALFRDVYWVSAVQGPLEQAQDFARTQLEEHSGTYEVKVLFNGPLPERAGVRVTELALERKRDKAQYRQWTAFYFEPGWDQAVRVHLFGVTDPVLRQWDRLKAAGLALRVSPRD